MAAAQHSSSVQSREGATPTAVTPDQTGDSGVQDNPVVVGGKATNAGGKGRAKEGASDAGVGRKTRKKAEPVDLFAPLSESVQAVIVEWQGIFKKPVPVTEALVKQATILVAFQPEPGEVAACRLWMYATDENKWYSTHGMHLGDVAREFGRFRSLSDVPKVTPIRIEKTDSPRYTKLPMPAAASHAKLPKPPVMIGGAR